VLGGTRFRQKGADPLALSFIVDLSARQAAEEQRQEADRRVRTILESITNFFAHVDAQWRYTYVNRRVEEYAGLSQEALLGKSFWEINPELLGTPVEQKLREAMATQQARHFEAWHPRWQRWLETHAYPAQDGLSLYTQDITERKQAAEALRESEMRFHGLVESNIIGIIVSDPEGTIYEANDAFLSLVGYTCEDLAAGRMNWVTMTAPEDQAQSMRALGEMLATGRFQPFEKDGSGSSEKDNLIFIIAMKKKKQTCFMHHH